MYDWSHTWTLLRVAGNNKSTRLQLGSGSKLTRWLSNFQQKNGRIEIYDLTWSDDFTQSHRQASYNDCILSSLLSQPNFALISKLGDGDAWDARSEALLVLWDEDFIVHQIQKFPHTLWITDRLAAIVSSQAIPAPMERDHLNWPKSPLVKINHDRFFIIRCPCNVTFKKGGTIAACPSKSSSLPCEAKKQSHLPSWLCTLESNKGAFQCPSESPGLRSLSLIPGRPFAAATRKQIQWCLSLFG